MKNWRQTGIALVSTVLLSVSAWAGAGPAGHSHDETFSAGEAGNPKKRASTVQITMGEADGKMMFMPNKVEVKKGERIKFMLRNNGELDHEFVLATTQENLEHAEMMKKNPEMRHVDPNARRVAPKQTSELVWKFTKKGTFEFACLIPGHYQAGMHGLIMVK
ncbi:MAG TPA: cupredoxin family protein [Casimicrobiaceae bacterium]|nr:cupredoxin family protein [Casimicrobiaceae bacterium]